MPRIPANFAAVFIDNFIRRGQPGAADAIFPRFMEENAIFTYPVFPVGLQWRRVGMQTRNFDGAVGAVSVTDNVVPATALRYLHAISIEHNDATAREAFIQIFDPANPGSVVTVESGLINSNQVLAVKRSVVVGETLQIRAILGAIAGGSFVRLREYSVDQGLAGPLPAL